MNSNGLGGDMKIILIFGVKENMWQYYMGLKSYDTYLLI